MLSDEEKKAMKYFYNLRATIDESNMLFDEDINVKCGKETIEQITIILNLIEKQSKEIEELKSRNQEKEEALEEWINGERVSIHCVHKDKIKAEIEEQKNMRVDGEVFTTAVNYAIKILQSLLEKEQ